MKQTHIIVGTAGHVDHGKTHLTIALTGIDTDRLPEEKRRGLTIVPGFVPLDLKSGRRLGLIDVPGHEQFVKNMLAGVAGIDMALFVVAADEGVMPQTIEHLNILNLLGIHKGVVAITKSDLVDDEWLAMITEDVKKLLAPTALKDAPIIAVSAQTGFHIEELKELLDQVATTIQERPSSGLCRLPIDRVFHKQGFGSIITGTLWAGHISTGEMLELLPAGVELRVRGIQVHGQEVNEAWAGQRTALNLTGESVESLKPGEWLAEPGLLKETNRIDVELTLLKSAPNIAKHGRVRIFHGTTEVLGRVRLLDREVLLSGATCLCQLELEEPLAPLRGDRIILRSYSPVVTIAGATVLDVDAPHYKLSSPDTMKTIQDKANLDMGQGIVSYLTTSGKLSTVKEIAQGAQLALPEVTKALGELEAMDCLQKLSVDGVEYYYSLEEADTWQQQIMSTLTAYHKTYPLRRGVPAAELRQKIFKKLPVKQFNALMEHYEQQGVVKLSADGMVAEPDFVLTLSPEQQKNLTYLAELYKQHFFAPPQWEEAIEPLHLKAADAQEYLSWLVDNKHLQKIGGLFFAYGAGAESQQLLRSKYPKEFTIAEARDVWKTSRKYALVLLDELDGQGITKREGDKRIFMK